MIGMVMVVIEENYSALPFQAHLTPTATMPWIASPHSCLDVPRSCMSEST
jgi:hypothetical protein